MGTYYVYPGATGANNGTSKTDAWTTIKSAFDNLSAGDICYCRGIETLTGAISINQNNSGNLTNGYIKFIGVNDSWINDGTRYVIDGNNAVTRCIRTDVSTNYWWLENIEVKRATARGFDPNTTVCAYWVFINCGFNNNGNHGIGQAGSYMRYSNFIDCEAKNNSASGFATNYYNDWSFCRAIGNSGYGFYLGNVAANVYGCISHNNNTGLYAVNIGVQIKNSVIDGNTTYGIQVNAVNLTVFGCRITNNGTGIYLNASGDFCYEDWNVYYNNSTKFTQPAGSKVFEGGNSLVAADTTEEGYTDRPNDDFNLTDDAILKGTEIDIDGTNKFRITAGLPPEYIDEAARNTDPGIANVKENIAYKILNVDYIGVLVITPLPTPNAPVIAASGISQTENRVLIRFTANAVKYEVYHADDAQKTNIALLNNNVVKNYFVHSGLTAGTTRYYFVKAVNNNDDKSGYSVGAPATTLIGHPRKLIRDKVKLLLTGNVTYSGNPVNIFTSRAIALKQIQLPCIAVYGKKEDSDHRESFPRINWNDFDIVTQIFAEADTGEGGEDICNEISNQVEGIIGVNRQGLGLEPVDEVNYGGGGFRIDNAGEKKVISLIQAYIARYQKEFPSENDQNTWSEGLTDFNTQITDIAVGEKGEINSETDLP